jgi:hypothetical protein
VTVGLAFFGRENFFVCVLGCFFVEKLKSSAASVLKSPLPSRSVLYRPLPSFTVL